MTKSEQSIWAVIPVKAPSDAKSRLACLLTVAERTALVKWMFERVLKAVHESGCFRGVVAVVCEPEMAAIAKGSGADVATDRTRSGPNAAVEQGRCFDGIGLDERVLVLPGDLPTVSCKDIVSLIAAARDKECVVICPDRRREGTNALCFPAKSKFSCLYGPASFQAHVDQTKAVGLRPEVYFNENISFDVDTPADLHDLLSRSAPSLPFLQWANPENAA